MIGPPTNSASVNCQPRSTASKIPSSITRLVEANSNVIAAVKSAPLRKIERARATAAYEHDDEAAPSPQAIASDLGASSGSNRPISPLETTACTTADSANPRTRAHRISHVIENAKSSCLGDRRQDRREHRLLPREPRDGRQ
jgi:hypothetical protein